ncbi:response regulator transcription factor [Ferrovum sp.]|jgi:DNA-binding response OmpR family regulator|uniref:response regulator transcription factor n=1 Tax=Ferrovum sp. TaxID=2609467 RepID=UPI00261394D0|nr:response regulator transcription factor [Ferrovum sp.]
MKVLCIEDDHEMADLIAEELQDRGVSIQLTHDGQAGLEAIERERPDLVLCDIGLPTLSGFEVLEKVLATLPNPPPFIFLTALTDRESELHGRRLGADDYVTKPIDFDVLYEILRARLGRMREPLPAGNGVELAEREREVLTWSARGKTSSEIALILGLSKRTVDFHIDNARTKLGVATRIEAAIRAASLGLITP